MCSRKTRRGPTHGARSTRTSAQTKIDQSVFIISIDQISGSIAAVLEIAEHMFFGQNLLGVSNGCVQGGDRTCHERSKALLELRPAQFDGIEIGRVGR